MNVEQIGEGAQATEREKQQVLDYVRRRAKPRFYADEDFPMFAIAMLRRRGADVLTTHEAGRRGHPDENHAAESLRLARILITCNRDYLDERRFPLIHCPAIVVCAFGRGTAKDTAKTFGALFGPFTAPSSTTNGPRLMLHPTAGRSMCDTSTGLRHDFDTESTADALNNGQMITVESLSPA
jgi:hypothetical protein